MWTATCISPYLCRHQVNILCVYIVCFKLLLFLVRCEVDSTMKSCSSKQRKLLQELDSQLQMKMKELELTTVDAKTLARQRSKTTVAKCIHKIGIVVPYDKKTDVGYRSLPIADSMFTCTFLEYFRLNTICACRRADKTTWQHLPMYWCRWTRPAIWAFARNHYFCSVCQWWVWLWNGPGAWVGPVLSQQPFPLCGVSSPTSGLRSAAEARIWQDSGAAYYAQAAHPTWPYSIFHITYYSVYTGMLCCFERYIVHMYCTLDIVIK